MFGSIRNLTSTSKSYIRSYVSAGLITSCVSGFYYFKNPIYADQPNGEKEVEQNTGDDHVYDYNDLLEDEVSKEEKMHIQNTLLSLKSKADEKALLHNEEFWAAQNCSFCRTLLDQKPHNDCVMVS